MIDRPVPERTAWEMIPAGEVLERLGSGPDGLDRDEAGRRLERSGPNVLPHGEVPPFWLLFLRQFASPLIAILGAAGVFAAAIGEFVDAGFIAGVLLLNATIGSIQEWRAERGARALQQLLRIIATVVRGGDARALDAADLVPGDIVHLEPGQSVPADLRLIHSHALEIDESLLTGESLPVGKDAAWVAEVAQPVADRRNMGHAGTLVIRGRATGVVVATGTRTEVGRIAKDLTVGKRTEAPLLIRMRRFARVVGIAVLVAAALLAAIGVSRGESLREMVLFAVAAAVSAVPEGLPVALTIALAVGTNRMARRRVIVRRLAAVEGLGSCTLIATDKTGTLTMNALTVREARTPDGTVYAVSGEGFEPTGEVLYGAERVGAGEDPDLDALARAVVLCNEATLLHPSEEGGTWSWSGDPTDVALLTFGEKLGLRIETEREGAPLVDSVPFEPERRYAATAHARDGVGVLYVKGAPERVLSMCSGLEMFHALAEAEDMARAGLRVLAVAGGSADPEATAPIGEVRGLSFLGFVGMMDPPRPGVPEAIEQAHAAGLQVVMVTGDHPTTAASIAAAVRIPATQDTTLTGAELEGLGEEELQERVRGITVFARVAPHQKLEIVRAAQAAGHFVAVTGDGVNDAPALRAAHIGVAMGRSGTDVAREAADIVLTDDAFPSVVAGIEEGRVAYGNVRNVVFLLVSTGAAELVLLLLALSTGLPVPLLPAQLLWLNLVTNGIQDVALGMEPGKGDELDRPPRHPRERIFDRLMVERTIVGALVMGLGGFFVFRWLLQAGWEVPAARNALLLLMVLYENLHVGNSRSERRSAFRLSPLRNPFLLWGAVVAQLLHIATLYIPFMQRVLRTEPVTFATWSTLLAVALTVVVVFEIHKVVRRRWPVRQAIWDHVRDVQEARVG